MQNEVRSPRLLGSWIHTSHHEIHANIWQLSCGEFVGLLHIDGRLVEAVEAPILDDLLSALTSLYGEGTLWIHHPNESPLEPEHP